MIEGWADVALGGETPGRGGVVTLDRELAEHEARVLPWRERLDDLTTAAVLFLEAGDDDGFREAMGQRGQVLELVRRAA